MVDKPEPCPFCGEEDLLEIYGSHSDEGSVYVACLPCSAQGPWAKGVEEAKLQWNLLTKKCPFCSSGHITVQSEDPCNIYLKCQSCEAQGPMSRDVEGAKYEWNVRT